LLKNRLAPATGQAKSRIGATLEQSAKKKRHAKCGDQGCLTDDRRVKGLAGNAMRMDAAKSLLLLFSR